MGELIATINSITEVALKTYEVTFKLGSPLFFEPGQSVELCLTETTCANKRDNCQQFPIVSSTNGGKELKIVFSDTGSCFAQSLLALKAGAQVSVRGPVGDFLLQSEPDMEAVFLAEGVGIAPFMSMVHFSEDNNLNLPITLIYAKADSRHSIYVNELEELAAKSRYFKLVLEPGDVDAAFIRTAIQKPTDKKWYVAGPSEFILAMRYRLQEIGVMESNISSLEISEHGNKTKFVSQRIGRSRESKSDRANIAAKSLQTEDTSNFEQIIAEMKVKELELENTKKAILNILEDLDEEKKAVERRVEERTLEIKNEKEKLHQVTKNIKDGVILLDNNGVVIFANEGLYQLFDIEPELPVANVLAELFKYFETTDFKDSFARCFKKEVFTLSEVESQGKIFEIFFNNLQVKNNGAVDVHYFILFTDITEAKLLERSKSELVAVASHQLRTPLTAVRGNIEMLIDESYGPLNEQQRELLSDVDISTARLISMVNDMLDITKIERGNLDMVLEYVSIKETINSICSDLSEYAKRRGVTIEIDIAEDTKVYGDKSRVRQVLQNLIDNSIKYSKKPGVLHISKSVEGDFAKITLKDNGLGIPRLEQSKIFNRFYRASNTKNTSSSGSGLGLYIVKSIVEQLHGDIDFESEENVGTTFYVSFPMSE